MKAAEQEPNQSRLNRLEQASKWLQLLRTADVSSLLVEEWVEWHESDPLNERAFREIVGIWEAAQRPQS